MSARKFGRRLALIIEFEPSWFSEFTSALGLLLGSLAVLAGGHFDVSGRGWMMPAAALAFGPLRVVLLFRLWPMPRVLAACAGFVWWASLTWSLFLAYGLVLTVGAFAALAVGDMLTVTKFSLAALRHRKQGGVCDI